MSQQRECCCGAPDEPQISCMSGDKITRDFADETRDGKIYSWKSTPVGANVYGVPPTLFSGWPIGSSDHRGWFSTRTNPPRAVFDREGTQVTNQWATSGESCMLCNHALIMSVKRPTISRGGYLEKKCPNDSQAPCPEDATGCNQYFYYSLGANTKPEEEDINLLYLHWKDYWVLEPVRGIPYTYYNEGPSLGSLDGPIDRFAKGTGFVSSLSNSKQIMGARCSGASCLPAGVNNRCDLLERRPTDANYMCNPELKRTTNPFTPYFQVERGDITTGTLGGIVHTEYLEAAWYGCYNTRTEPEMMTVCSASNANRRPFDHDNTERECPSNDSPVVPNCGAGANPGFSSWQMFMMSNTPQLRTMSDVVTFGNGIPVHATLRNSDAIDNQLAQYWTNLYGSMVGVLHRVRVFVRADRASVRSDEPGGRPVYPCTTGFGSFDPDDPYATKRGSCCVPGGPCVDNITREQCEAGWAGDWIPHDYCLNENPSNGGDPWGSDPYDPTLGGRGTNFCDRVNREGEYSGNNASDDWVTHCGTAIEDSWKITCEDRVSTSPLFDPPLVDSGHENPPELMCRSEACDVVNGASLCSCEAEDGPSSEGRVVSYHPPLTNTRMLHLSNAAGGYTPCQKQRSGAWAILYYCAGVPVFAEEAIEILTVEEQGQLYDWVNWTGACLPSNIEPDCQCSYMGNIAEKLGSSGKFNAKDWRPDQLEKYNTLEFELHTIAAEARANPPAGTLFLPPEEYETVIIPSKIRNHITPNPDGDQIGNTLLPVQKTGENFLHAYINLAIGKDKSNQPPEISTNQRENNPAGVNSRWQLTEMGNYQVTGGTNNVYDISRLDPWHPASDSPSDEYTLWPKLGTERQEVFPITLNSTNGVDGTFEFRYPIPEIYEAFYGDDWDPNYIPAWEEEMFKAWYSNIAIYFHTVPGGWAWSGTGWGPVERNPNDPGGTPGSDPDNPARPGCSFIGNPYSPFAIGNLDSIYQLSINTMLCGGDGGPASACCDFNFNCGVDCPYPSSDPFPNNMRMIEGDQGIYVPVSDLLLHDAEGRSTCVSISDECAGLASGFQYQGCGDAECSGVQFCCPKDRGPMLLSEGPEECDLSNDQCINENPDGQDCCIEGLAPGGMKNECREVRPYPPAGEPLVFKRADYIKTNNPKRVGPNSPVGIVAAWNRENKNAPVTERACRNAKCNTSGGCGIGCKCCCPDGCDGECFCIGKSEICAGAIPCTQTNKWNSPCCEAYGSCCYLDSDGKLKCVDNVSKEQCTSPKDIGGLNGIFNEEVLCTDFPCPTKEDSLRNSGTCCYTNTLTKNNECIETSNITCTLLGGTWTDGEVCSDTSCDTTENTYRRGGDGSTSCDLCDGDNIDPCDQNTWPENVTFTACCTGSDCTHVCNVGGVNCQACSGDLISNKCCSEVNCADPVGACCFQDDGIGGGGDSDSLVCESNLTQSECEATSGFVAWSVGVNCNEEGVCTGSGGGGDDCDGCVGVAEFCFPPGFVGYAGGLATQSTGPCDFKLHDAAKSCLVRHYQASAHAFRMVLYSSATDIQPDDLAAGCPLATLLGGGCDCCTSRDFPQLCGAPSAAGGGRCQSSPSYGETTGTNGVPLGRGPHNRKTEIVVEIYPYKIRCLQVKDINGFLKCGLLQSDIPIDHEEFTARLPRVLLGLVDPLLCNYNAQTMFCDRENTSCDSDSPCYFTGEECCSYGESSTQCSLDGGDPPCASCDGDSSDGCADAIPYWWGNPDCSAADFETKIPTGQTDVKISTGGACMGLNHEQGHMLRARSYVPPEYAGELYTNNNGVRNIPKWGCPDVTKRDMNELPRPLPVPDGTLQQCAEYWKDKELSKFQRNISEPEKTTEVIFKDYDNLGADAPCDVNFQYVDSDRTNENWDTFWIKQEFPDLESIRLFGVGCWNVDNGFEGGRGISGGFAGTMVLNFETEIAMRSFDAQRGHRNLKLEFNVDNPAGNEQGGFFDKRFVARPSRNPRWVDTDHDELISGWIGGRGLTYAHVATGTGPATGKVYQFCSEDDSQDEGALKPRPWSVGDDTDCNPVTYSGSRGIIALLADDDFSMTITEFNDRAGVTAGGFICCQNSGVRNDGGSQSCSSCSPGCGGDPPINICRDFGGDNPVCTEEASCNGA